MQRQWLCSGEALTDREHKALLRKIQSYITKWERLLGLKGQWTISIALHRGGFDDRSDGAVMSVDTQWKYRQAFISIDLPLALQETDERLEECIVHEMCHMMVHQIVEHDGLEHEEYVCTSLAQAFMRVASQGVK